MKPQKHILIGYEYQEKKVSPHSASSSMIYLPAKWAGKKVAVVLLEE